jgi:hypothetical protein
MKVNRMLGLKEGRAKQTIAELTEHYNRSQKAQQEMAADQHLHDQLLAMFPDSPIVLHGACERMARVRELTTTMDIIREMERRVAGGKIERRG